MTCDHPESARLLESRSWPTPAGQARETVVRCQRCGAVLYPQTTPVTEPEATPA